MNHLYYSSEERERYPVTFLVPSIRKDEIQRAYIEPYAVDKDEILVLDLHYSQTSKKTSMTEMRAYISEVLVPILRDAGTEYVVVADAEYFKALTKAAKTEVHLGYVMDSEFGPWKVIYVPNYKAMFYDPIKVTAKIKQGMEALVQARQGQYRAPGTGIIHYAEYPQSTVEIKAWLDKLLAMDCPLTIDIEGFSLKHYKAGIGTISFAWNQNEGIAFPVDYVSEEWDEVKAKNTVKHYGRQGFNAEVRALLKDFFCRLTQKAIYHNIAYDAYVLIYQLFMKDILDTEGLLTGLSVMLRNWDCTKLITYLATNSCAGNKLGLKDQAQEFAGNYAVEEIKDITLVPLPKLLEYNLVDSLSTWFVYQKRYGTMIQDQQFGIYEQLFQPATLDIVQMQLTGMPVNMQRVLEVEQILDKDRADAMGRITGSPLVQAYQYARKEVWVEERNTTLKKKRVTLADAEAEMLKAKSKVLFNPGSPDQLQELLYSRLNLPVIALTDSKQPSCDGDTLKALRNHTSDQRIKDLLNALLDFTAVEKILTSFIKALKASCLGPDGWYYLFGNFNLGGTVSGRLSSSKPNLQNLPATSKYAKLIKSCFQAPPGWLFMGLDFASLEDRISALTTKDPNKLRVYTDGFDGHSLRAVSYWPEEMPDIDMTSVTSVNSLAVKGSKYSDWRQESKAPTFLLTYGGTYLGMMKNLGWSEEKSKQVEKRYHDLYVVSDQWVAAKLDQASKDGYITAAFGLRVRTPLLHQVIRGNSRTPYEAQAEGRTAGNALGQSWCLLNSRASTEFMGKVRISEHRLNIRPCAHIHDAQYFMIRDDMAAVLYTNKHLVQAVNWQNHPDIAHPTVGLGGELSLFWPTWKDEMVIPNAANEEQICQLIEDHLLSLAPAA